MRISPTSKGKKAESKTRRWFYLYAGDIRIIDLSSRITAKTVALNLWKKRCTKADCYTSGSITIWSIGYPVRTFQVSVEVSPVYSIKEIEKD